MKGDEEMDGSFQTAASAVEGDVIDGRLKTRDSKVFIWPLFTFSQITYNKQLHKFLIYKVKETSIKTTCGCSQKSVCLVMCKY